MYFPSRSSLCCSMKRTELYVKNSNYIQIKEKKPCRRRLPFSLPTARCIGAFIAVHNSRQRPCSEDKRLIKHARWFHIIDENRISSQQWSAMFKYCTANGVHGIFLQRSEHRQNRYLSPSPLLTTILFIICHSNPKTTWKKCIGVEYQMMQNSCNISSFDHIFVGG